MSIPFVDCQGLAGAWTLGVVQTGKFELVHRTSLPGGFGDEVIDANRHLVGDGWEQETPPEREWTPQDGVGFLCGTPPCSGFSLLNRSKKDNARGPDSKINLCMRELIIYASRCTGTDGKRGPEIVSFESVQGAFNQGRSLMMTFRDLLRERTGQAYHLYHVKMSGSTIGAAQLRHRYYPVFARIPFGVDTPEPRHAETYGDAIGDLVDLELTWDEQELTNPQAGGAYSRRLQREDGKVDCHVTIADTNKMSAPLREAAEAGWLPGENLVTALVRLGLRPAQLEKAWNPERGEYKGWNWPFRIKSNRPGYVLTGAGIHGFVHWEEPRRLTVRECSRLMGYPDTWDWTMAKNPDQASCWIGKCCPVDSGRWIANWVASALEGNPGAEGEPLDYGESLYDFTLLYKRWPREITDFVESPRPEVAEPATVQSV